MICRPQRRSRSPGLPDDPGVFSEAAGRWISRNRPLDPDKVASSAAMAKVARFLTDLGDEDTKLGKAVRGVKDGVRIAQDIAKTYNGIAQWCGLPQVPRPFLGGQGSY
jgi:hypothetical protein